MEQAFIGVDVGTTSARAGIFDAHGRLLATARRPIAIWREPGDIVEQSSADIWDACASAVRAALAEAGLRPALVKGIGFDATCSLVVLDRSCDPLSVSTSGDRRRNIIAWMDHRAIEEAHQISRTGDEVLRHVGGSISPEMQMPKLLWLKRHLPATYRDAGHFFDLADYLSFRATCSAVRSMCTLTCKWTYLAHERRWSRRFFERVGLSELTSEAFARIGSEIVEPGTPLANGLTPLAAEAFGLRSGTPVGASLIDAHAGVIGTIGGLDFSNYYIPLSKSVTATTLVEAKKQGPVLAWGNFVTFVINFILIAWVLFLAIKGMNRMRLHEEAKPAPPPRQEVLLEEIRDLLAKK